VRIHGWPLTLALLEFFPDSSLFAGLIEEWSASTSAATGLKREDVVGKKTSDVLSPAGAVSNAIADAVAGKVTEGLVVWLHDKSDLALTKCSGRLRMLLQVAQAAASDGGGVQLIGQDISSEC